MEREIRFRAFNRIEKRMFKVYGLGENWVTEDTFDGVNVGSNAFTDSDYLNNIVVMQFTGLKDINGVDIYEGDIVIPFSLENNNNVSTIVYKGNQFAIKGKTLYWLFDLRQIKVIGNIHENENLL